MLRSAGVALVVASLVCGCDAVSFVKDSIAHSNEAAAEIQKQVGVKPEIGFNYNNGTFTSVTVKFPTVPPGDVTELEKVVRAAVVQAFKQEPNELVVSFAFKKKS